MTEMPTMVEAATAIARGDTTAVELLERCAAAIDAHNDELNAFVHLDLDGARRAAADVDAARARGEALGPLAGVPFGVKDLEDCAGMPTSQGSLLYLGGPPAPQDSIHVARLRAAGAIPIGKTATPEFGTLQFTRSRALGVTRNAWDLSATPGGSSGGSAAAVAAGLVPFCTASDGGGSTRIPASFSGLFGMKASFGRVPSPSADPSQTTSLGVLVTSVRDAAVHLDLAAGPDDRDRTSLPPPAGSYVDAVDHLDTRGLRIGWSVDLGFAVVDPEVAELARAAAEVVASEAGGRLIELEVTLTDPVRTWLGAGVIGDWLEIADAPNAYPDRLGDLTPYVASTLRQTADRPVPTLVKPLRRREQLAADTAVIFEQVDVLLTPTTAVTAFAAEGPPPATIAGEDMAARFGEAAAGAMNVPFTMLANLCGNPACSVPAGLASDSLPVGLQVIGRRHADDVVLRLARLYELARPWPRHAPMGRD
ncbi:MAG TPA: amidase family protein [Acidimicrobiales bacterium]|nr:amidase family protein [Acidimicrobiales bacterium]